MIRPVYLVQVKLEGGEYWLELTRSYEAEHCAAVVATLLRADKGPNELHVHKVVEITEER